MLRATHERCGSRRVDATFVLADRQYSVWTTLAIFLELIESPTVPEPADYTRYLCESIVCLLGTAAGIVKHGSATGRLLKRAATGEPTRERRIGVKYQGSSGNRVGDFEGS